MVENAHRNELRRLYGREAEVAALDRHIRTVASGRSGVVLIDGARGSGKTSLLDDAALRARRDGVAWLHAAPAGRELHTPLGPLIGALGASGVSTVDDAAGCLARRAAHQPVVVAVDDLQLADDATLMALRTLPDRLAGQRILWLLTVAPGRADTTAAALRQAGAATLHLAPLARHAVRELAHEVLRGVPNEAVLDLVDDLGGHPSDTIDLLRALVMEGVIEITGGRARVTGQGLYRALTELRTVRPPMPEPTPMPTGAIDGSLTKSELAVAELVAQGATNRQAAERLFVSIHTVSTHLRHTFEKLGIRSRVELAVLFAGRSTTSELTQLRGEPARHPIAA